MHSRGRERGRRAHPGLRAAPDFDSAAVLGWYHWLRFQAEDGVDQEKLVQAVRLLAPVHAVDPGAVPEELAAVYAGDEGTDAEEALEYGLLLGLAHERSGAVPLLRRATELFRIAVAGPSSRASTGRWR
ncbi:hypothetical protein ACFQVA_23890 [Actinomadura keratinilytica]